MAPSSAPGSPAGDSARAAYYGPGSGQCGLELALPSVFLVCSVNLCCAVPLTPPSGSWESLWTLTPSSWPSDPVNPDIAVTDEDGNCKAAVCKACAFWNYLYAKITFAHHVQPGGSDLIHSVVSHPLPFS
uniref:Uncharacterized protein LOC109548674 isoform X1 n=1 Tax=Tursiops truncatus TaxID=9739 RepID=A0A6J3QD21_TURTR|nr:uncharacterized protein LOC109548674 isoform X1 [Tursiops truncatus]